MLQAGVAVSAVSAATLAAAPPLTDTLLYIERAGESQCRAQPASVGMAASRIFFQKKRACAAIRHTPVVTLRCEVTKRV